MEPVDRRVSPRDTTVWRDTTGWAHAIRRSPHREQSKQESLDHRAARSHNTMPRTTLEIIDALELTRGFLAARGDGKQHQFAVVIEHVSSLSAEEITPDDVQLMAVGPWMRTKMLGLIAWRGPDEWEYLAHCRARAAAAGY